MGESVMRQGMESWLKKECIINGNQLSKISHIVNKIHDDIAPFEDRLVTISSLMAEPDFEHLRITLLSMEHKGIITKELAQTYRKRVDGLFNRYKYYDYATTHNALLEEGLLPLDDAILLPVEDITDLTYDINMFLVDSEIMAFEAIVECQCGKQGGV